VAETRLEIQSETRLEIQSETRLETQLGKRGNASCVKPYEPRPGCFTSTTGTSIRSGEIEPRGRRIVSLWGAGPIGLTAALSLARLGTSCVNPDAEDRFNDVS
jgi:NADPH-dependent 2,4-dienoyl-CoA reductase/sulfur reductase-like enzyme